jgi:hypothetical protein
MSFKITLPYSPYRVPVDSRGTTISLGKNSQLRFGKNHQRIVRQGKRQMIDDTLMLVRATLLENGLPEMRLPLFLDAVITTRTKQRKDDDGAIVALYPARDAIAEALGIDDSDIRSGTIRFETGTPEETEVHIHTF